MQIKAFFVLAFVAAASAGTIDNALLNKLKAQGTQNIIIALPNPLNEILASPSMASLTGDAKVDRMVVLLEETTQFAQANLMSAINARGVAAQQFWISNKIAIDNADLELIQALAAVEGDFIIREAVTVSISPAVLHKVSPFQPIQEDAQWGVAKVGAPAVWARGNRGENVVAAIIDTGANIGHVALSGNYAGQWLDPYHSTAGPTDEHGHGSHALGSILGTANGVGVAPGAKWIACRGLDHDGGGSEANLIRCAQFVLRANPKPHVVSNSWGSSVGGQTFYNGEVNAWRAANIIPVFANGNAGPRCQTAGSPGDQPNLIAVGSTTTTDALSSFSSRGKGSGNLMKPEVSAPGQNIISAGTGRNDYATMSGTSMATPHVAGAIALYLSANPGASYAQVLSALQSTAVQPSLTAADRNCGTANGSDYPNNAYGHGRINVDAAVRA